MKDSGNRESRTVARSRGNERPGARDALVASLSALISWFLSLFLGANLWGDGALLAVGGLVALAGLAALPAMRTGARLVPVLPFALGASLWLAHESKRPVVKSGGLEAYFVVGSFLLLLTYCVGIYICARHREAKGDEE